MRLGSRKTFAGLIVLGVLVLGVLFYFGVHRFDEDLELVDRRERCVAISQSAAPNGATPTETAQLERCRSEGWTPPAGP